MDIANILLFCLMSCIIGAVLMLLIQYYAFVRYFNMQESKSGRNQHAEKYSLPDDILKSIKTPDAESKNPIAAINLVLQFLFHELRHSNKVRKWFHRKLSVELDELIMKTTTGKLFDKLSIRDLDLGSQFPEIKNVRVHNVELHDTEGHIESLDLLLDLHYHGNFRLSIDADMVLGKKGFLSVKVKQVSGLARLQFTRKPYTHWSLSFLGDPQVDLGVESQFQGRQMQSNVTSLISNQIRKAVRRKHTLPNYKLRYKPFFHRVEEEYDASETAFNGILEVKVSELSRLLAPSNVTDVYCTLTLASIPWVVARQQDDRNIVIALDLEIHKAKNQQIGIVFKQTDHMVIVEAIIPNTPAAKAKLHRGDVLLSIEGKRVTHINHVAKIVKNLNRPMFTLRIERLAAGQIRNDAVLEDFEEYEDLNEANISFSKNTDSVQIGRGRKNSTDRATSSDSSLSNTPTTSPNRSIEKQSNRIISRANSQTESRPSSGQSPNDDEILSIKATKNLENKSKLAETNATGSPVGSAPVNQQQPQPQQNQQQNSTIPSTATLSNDYFAQHSTVDCPMNSLIVMEDLSTFRLNENSTFFNINVYGKSNDNENILLGYLNIPIASVLAECGESSLGHYIKQYSLVPPDAPNLSSHPLSTQSGFDPYLCFGDVLLSFVWNGVTTLTTPTGTSAPITESSKKNKTSRSSSTDKLEEDRLADGISVAKQHDFIRTHFHRSTQCEFCGKKIWLKDAVQCKECAMCCHKKCVTKCQNSTVCGPVDGNTLASVAQQQQQQTPQPEFKLTEAPPNDDAEDLDENDDQLGSKRDVHRQSFSDLLTQGLKRVNSANNLVIPGIVSSLSQSSRSLPPSPQHTPRHAQNSRKQSLSNQVTNPFIAVSQRLEALSDDISELSLEQIDYLIETLVGCGTPDEMMSLAKTASRGLYSEHEPAERVDKINGLLSKLRLALDSATSAHANLYTMEVPSVNKGLANTSNQANTTVSVDAVRVSSDTTLLLQTRGPSSVPATPTTKDNEHEMARRAFLIGQSEERVQALSVVMLYLCTGLQHAQGVAGF